MSFGFGFGLPSWQTLSGGFSPASLFSAGEQGVLYQVDDYSTLFQDAAGTTPVTGVEQFVGLMLDKSKGLVLGSERVTNGDFSSGTTTGWTTGPNITATVVSGAVNVSRSGGITPVNTFGQSTTTIANRWYKVSLQLLQNNGAAFSFTDSAGGSYPGFNPQSFSAGTGLKEFLVYVTDTTLRLNLWTNDLTTSIFDNISVRELPGNHATSTGTKRPKLAARYNLLTYTEQFDNAVWAALKANISVTPNTTVAPDGTTTADSLANTPVAGYLYQQATVGSVAGRTFTYSCWLWTLSGTASVVLRLYDSSATTINNTICNLTTTPTRFTLTQAFTSSDTSLYCGIDRRAAIGGDGLTGTIIAWGADLRPASQATGLIGPTYQRVAAATDYDAAGFLPYLQFDGIDDSMSTGSIDFTATDKMTVWAGVRRLSAAAFAVLSELSADYNSNNGSFVWSAPDGANNDIGFGLRGASTYSTASFTDATAPSTSVLSVGANKALTTDEVEFMRRNGTAQTLSRAFNQNTAGNFGNYPLFICARNNAGSYFNGWLTSLIVRGAQSTQSQIEATESWVNGKTGAY